MLTKHEAIINLIHEGKNFKYSPTATLRAVKSLRALDVTGASARVVLRFLELIDEHGHARPNEDESLQAKVAELIKE